MHDALTDLHAYVLALDADRQRIRDQLMKLGESTADRDRRAELDLRRTELDEEVNALQATVLALRQLADPAARFL